MNSLNAFASRHNFAIRSNERYRSPLTTKRYNGIHVIREGKKLISFCCNDYLGLCHHPDVMQSAVHAIEEHGLGAGSSRYITGNHPLYQQLEQALKEFKASEDSMIFGSGYLANIGIIPSLASTSDIILADKLSHACMIDGMLLSGASYQRFRHNDLSHLEELIQRKRKNYRHCLILTETVFSMDGDLAPITAMLDLCTQYDCWLMSDDAHGFGIIHHAVPNNAPYIQMGTLSKAVGAYGGYVCATTVVIEYLRNISRTAIYNTALPPAIVNAALTAITHIQNNPRLGATAIANAKLFCNVAGLPEAESTIVPVIVRENAKALQLSKILEDEGFLVAAIRPPTVPVNTARLRFTFSALHQKDDIIKAATLIAPHIE